MNPKSILRAALTIFIVLQGIMLAALFTQTPPHPPLKVEPFALAPFLAASISLAAAALVLGAENRLGVLTAMLATLLALVSYGPQKWFDPVFGEIWPAVIVGQIAAAGVVYFVWNRSRLRR